MSNDPACQGCDAPLGPYRYTCPDCGLRVLCVICRRAGRRCGGCSAALTPAARAQRLCQRLAQLVNTAPDWAARLAAADLHQRATALWYRLAQRETPQPPPPPATPVAQRPARTRRPDGIHLNLRYGGWDAVVAGHRVAASRPRLDAEREYDRAA